MPVVNANNIRIYYELHGDGGEPLVFLSGLGADHRVWDAFLPKFARKYRCLVCDNRGVGRTEKPRGRYSTALLARDVAALMAAVDVSRTDRRRFDSPGRFTARSRTRSSQSSRELRTP